MCTTLKEYYIVKTLNCKEFCIVELISFFNNNYNSAINCCKTFENFALMKIRIQDN